jgi:hypothetical protein
MRADGMRLNIREKLFTRQESVARFDDISFGVEFNNRTMKFEGEKNNFNWIFKGGVRLWCYNIFMIVEGVNFHI